MNKCSAPLRHLLRGALCAGLYDVKWHYEHMYVQSVHLRPFHRINYGVGLVNKGLMKVSMTIR